MIQVRVEVFAIAQDFMNACADAEDCMANEYSFADYISRPLGVKQERYIPGFDEVVEGYALRFTVEYH